MNRQLGLRLSISAVSLWALMGSAFAQSAQITGKITDSMEAVVEGATVSVRGSGDVVAGTATSDGDGLYTLPALRPGTYTVEVKRDGFSTITRSGMALTTALPARLDFNLGLAQAAPAPDGAGQLQNPDPGSGQAVSQLAANRETPQRVTREVIVTARGLEEEAQQLPIPVSVIGGDVVENAGAFNVNRLKEMIPTLQFYSTNPRNSSVQIRGLGAPFGLTNDGIEPGVGLYIDGVFYARPAAATLDFLDVERIEVLRGPQGTLFGKNTTAGAINVTTRKPSFTRRTDFELSYGNLGFVQAKASITGPLSDKVAGRFSFSGTQRDGTLFNVRTQDDVNDLNNLGVRGQLLYAPSDKIVITTALDYTRQRPEGYTQVVAGIAPTLRNPNRQYAGIAADLGYTPPSFNAFDRLTDVDTPLRSNQDLGGASFMVDWDLGPGRVTSITGWRSWNWNPSNDRDFIGLAVTPVSAAPSTQRQWTQELRYAGDLFSGLKVVVGAFAFRQTIDSDPSFKQEQGAAAARFLLAPSATAATPGLLDGYGFDQYLKFRNVSAALFGQIEWSITNRLRLFPGLRFNYDKKNVDFDQKVYGGLHTTNATLIGLQRSIFAPQAYAANVDDNNLSGQLTVAYSVAESASAYATYATGFKSIGLNLNGVPNDASDQPVLAAATVKPEDVRHIEFGLKTAPFQGVTANIALYNTSVKDFQAQVVNAGVGVLRGYLANAEKVRVRGIELDSHARVNDNLSFYGSAAYTDGKYVSFPDAPPPLEDTGGPQVKDISGSLLPGVSKWAASLGGEYTRDGNLFDRAGKFFGALDASYRSSFSSSATASRYLGVAGYSLLNARIGFRASDGWSVAVWSRNLLDKDYFELLSAAPGNTGLYVGQPGDARTFGVTLRQTF